MKGTKNWLWQILDFTLSGSFWSHFQQNFARLSKKSNFLTENCPKKIQK
jgi:hypothetical protein